jgi:rhodanese-related sulfurtransferase
MPQVIGREQVRELSETGARLVEVLPKKEYERVHLPGAANIPLTKLNRESAGSLGKSEPIVVYCYDYQ